MTNNQLQLTEEDKKEIEEFYNHHLSLHGANSALSLNWIDKSTQFLRFKILSQVGDLSGVKILDVGCGLADFYSYLKTKFQNISYTGIDIVKNFIDVTSKRYPEANFFNTTIQDYNPDAKFDYAFASGMFTYNIQNHKEKYFPMIDKMFGMAEKGIAFNMLNRKVFVPNDVYLSFYPSDVYEYCKNITRNVEVIENYLPQDFTIYMKH